jgi:hypothetical protein
VQSQLGHTDPTITLRFYARVMNRRDGEPDLLRPLVERRDWVAAGSSEQDQAAASKGSQPVRPVESGV